MSQEPIKDKEYIFSPDGTGLPTSMKQTGKLTENPHDNESLYVSADAAYLSGTIAI